MKHKNSILICQLDNGQLNLHVNGATVLVGDLKQSPIERIANCTLNNVDAIAILEGMIGKLWKMETERTEAENKAKERISSAKNV